MNRKFGLILAALHLGLFFATLLYTLNSPTEQASLAWVYWAVIDLPWSLLYWVSGEHYAIWVEQLGDKHLILANLLYLPHLIHGVIGTIWWYFLPSLTAVIISKAKQRLA